VKLTIVKHRREFQPGEWTWTTFHTARDFAIEDEVVKVYLDSGYTYIVAISPDMEIIFSGERLQLAPSKGLIHDKN
jgi:hypothetical protein